MCSRYTVLIFVMVLDAVVSVQVISYSSFVVGRLYGIFFVTVSANGVSVQVASCSSCVVGMGIVLCYGMNCRGNRTRYVLFFVCSRYTVLFFVTVLGVVVSVQMISYSSCVVGIRYCSSLRY